MHFVPTMYHYHLHPIRKNTVTNRRSRGSSRNTRYVRKSKRASEQAVLAKVELKSETDCFQLRGWLYKRGVKGLTANVWRRRYFRLDQGDKMHYYKSEADFTSKG